MYITLQSRHCMVIPTSKQNMPIAQCTKIALIFTPQCIHRHIASYLKEGELILNKNLDKREKIPYQNDQNPNPWV